MKKILSVIIAVCALTVGISASAATSNGTLSQDAASRNNKAALGKANDNGTYADATALPAFRAGDILEFDVSGLTTENQLTLISYKQGADISNTTIQYINQYALDSESKTIRYKIRDIEDGIYKIALNGNDGSGILKFFYKVGTPDVSIVKGENNKNYVVSKDFTNNAGETVYSIAFVAQATIGSGNVSFADIGLESLGLEFNLQDSNGNVAYSDLSEDQISALLGSTISEVNGAITLYYGLTMYNIPASDIDSIIATPRLDGVAVSAE